MVGLNESFRPRLKDTHGAMQALAVALVTTAAILCALTSAFSGEADVVGAEATQTSDGLWRFDVSVRHDDQGWDHYADSWDVGAPDGTIYGTRELLHPHDQEQPFTRSLSGVAGPEGVDEVVLRAHDNVHGHGGEELTITLPRAD